MMLSRPRLVGGTVLLGLFAAAFTVDLAGVRAESPMEFLRREHRQYWQVPRYEREPVHVERHRVPRRSLFGDLFEDLRRNPEPEAQPRPPVAANLQRVICRRTCDGAELALGILPARKKHREAEAMCAAAGGGAEARLVIEKFVPGAGFRPPQMIASTAPLQEGRSAAAEGQPVLQEGRSALVDAPAAKAGSAAPRGDCGPAVTRRFMTVPILHDATLRNGDIVATQDGFKVFVGKGKPPFDEKDFVDIDKKKRLAKSVRDLRIADR